eukprot:9450876-Lingulodinium_polyedra.AAC.1
MALEEYRQWCQKTAQQQTVHGGSGNVPTEQGEGGNAPPTPLDSGVWAKFFAQDKGVKATAKPATAGTE